MDTTKVGHLMRLTEQRVMTVLQEPKHGLLRQESVQLLSHFSAHDKQPQILEFFSVYPAPSSLIILAFSL